MYLDEYGLSGGVQSRGKAKDLMEQMISQGDRVANKYSRLLEGLKGFDRITTAILIENYRNFVGQLDETTKAVQIGTFDKYASTGGAYIL